MAGHAQLKFVMTECSKTQIRLAGLIYRGYVTITGISFSCLSSLEETKIASVRRVQQIFETPSKDVIKILAGLCPITEPRDICRHTLS